MNFPEFSCFSKVDTLSRVALAAFITPPTLLLSQFGKLVGVGGVGVGEKTSPLPKSHLLSVSVIFQARCGIGQRHLD